MRVKQLLAAFSLGVGLCFVPALGDGEIREKEVLNEGTTTLMMVLLLKARVNYVMGNPDNFLFVDYIYDSDGDYGRIGKYQRT